MLLFQPRSQVEGKALGTRLAIYSTVIFSRKCCRSSELVRLDYQSLVWKGARISACKGRSWTGPEAKEVEPKNR